MTLETKMALPRGLLVPIDLQREKHKKNLLRNHKAQSFHILSVAMFFINPANRAPGVHTGPALGGSWVKHKSFSLKPQGPELSYFVMASWEKL